MRQPLEPQLRPAEGPDDDWRPRRFGTAVMYLPPRYDGNKRSGLLSAVDWRLLAVALVLVLTATAIAYAAGGSEALLELGYPGIFLATLLSAASMFIPVPLGPAAVTLGALLDAPLGLPAPLLVGIVAGSGSALGEITGYLAGSSGKARVSESRLGARISRDVRRYGPLAIFAFAMIPNPFLDVVGIAAGAAGLRLPGFIAGLWPGKVINYTLLATLAALGVDLFGDLQF